MLRYTIGETEMANYKTSTRIVHGEKEITVYIEDDVVAKFYGPSASSAFLCWRDGAGNHSARMREEFSVFDITANQYISGTLGQLLNDAE